MAEMMKIENEILIDAPVETVWDLLTNPEKTKLYMYGCEVVCDWKLGDEMLWRGSTDDIIYVKGKLVDYEEGTQLAYTVIDPNGDYPDIPENYLTVTYQLEEQNDKTHLSVSQGDYSQVADGEKRYNDSAQAGGWQSVLEKIKEIAESE